MKQKHIVLLIIKFGYGFCSIFGLCPFWYSPRKHCFESAWCYHVYPLIVYISFSYFYLTSGLSVISLLNPLVMIAFVYMTMITISVIFLVQNINANHIVSFLNGLLAFLKKLNNVYENKNEFNYREPILLILFKTVLVSCIAQIAVINCCVILGTMMTGQIDYFVMFIMSVAYFLQTIVPNMFYALVLGATFHYKLLNVEIEKVIKTTDLVSRHCNINSVHKRRAIFFKLSERLDYIASFHAELTAKTIEANGIWAIQLLVSNANSVGILLIQVSRCFQKNILLETKNCKQFFF